MRSTRSDGRASRASLAFPEPHVAGARAGAANAWWLAIRPRTLGAGVVPVLVGLALAYRSAPLRPLVALATLLAALLLQVASNLANDYYDFAHGVDTAERLGPTRVTQSGLVAAGSVKRAVYAVLLVALAIGIYLVRIGGWPIAFVGGASAAGAVAYSAGPWPLAWYGLGDLLAFVFFGLVAVGGTVFLQLGSVGWPAVVAAVPVACMVTAIIVVNNLRDIPSDRATGKRTLAVRLGPTGTRVEYTTLVGLAFASLFAIVPTIAPGALLALLALPLAVAEVRWIWRREGADLNHSLIGTARLHLVAGLLLAAGLLL